MCGEVGLLPDSMLWTAKGKWRPRGWAAGPPVELGGARACLSLPVSILGTPCRGHPKPGFLPADAAQALCRPRVLSQILCPNLGSPLPLGSSSPQESRQGHWEGTKVMQGPEALKQQE